MTLIETKNRLYGTKLSTLDIALRDTSMKRIMEMEGTKILTYVEQKNRTNGKLYVEENS
jgi:hypothetical protein